MFWVCWLWQAVVLRSPPLWGELLPYISISCPAATLLANYTWEEPASYTWHEYDNLDKTRLLQNWQMCVWYGWRISWKGNWITMNWMQGQSNWVSTDWGAPWIGGSPPKVKRDGKSRQYFVPVDLPELWIFLKMHILYGFVRLCLSAIFSLMLMFPHVAHITV